MPNHKNSFTSPDFVEETVVDETGAKLGTIRIRPSSVLWKPVNKRKFYSVSLKAFTTWITAEETAAKQKAS
jgi:hypothetical protein